MNGTTLQLVIQLGALGVLLALLAGLGAGFKLVFPAARDFLTGLVAELRELRTAQGTGHAVLTAGHAVLVGKVDALAARVDAQASLSVEQLKRHVDEAGERVADVVRDRASHVVDEAREAVRLPMSTGEHAALSAGRAACLPSAPGR
jgi:hypothetical protein